MYYHTNMRYAAFITILLLLAVPALAAEPSLRPNFVLQDAVLRDWGLKELAPWREQRVIEGIGWKLGTVARGDGDVMSGGYTVVHPAKGTPFSWKHYYVLAAFDLMPSGFLVIAVRDPELYWEGYDFKAGVTDPVEAIWYDSKWQEESALRLEFATDDFPDGFILAPDQKNLVTILHPVNAESELIPTGHSLSRVRLLTGEISRIPLPGTGDYGVAPAAWWPVLMAWSDGGDLLMQAGEEFRRYTVSWE